MEIISWYTKFKNNTCGAQSLLGELRSFRENNRVAMINVFMVIIYNGRIYLLKDAVNKHKRFRVIVTSKENRKTLILKI